MTACLCCWALVVQSTAARSEATEPADPLIVPPAWVIERLEAPDLIPIDLRDADAYDTGHLPGAVRLPLPDGKIEMELEQLRDRLGQLGVTGSENLVLYGESEHRKSIGWLFWLLESAGCSRVRVLGGDLSSWTAAGGELESAKRHRPSGTFTPQTTRSPVIDLLTLRDSFGQKGLEVLDLRDGVDWTRANYEAPPAFRAGHIPSSLPYDFGSLLPEPGGWPEVEEVRRSVRRIGPRQSTYVNIHATFALYGDDAGDRRLGLGYLLMRMAGISVQVFAEGFRGWVADGGPVVRIIDAAELGEMLAGENPELATDRLPRRLMLFDNRGERTFAEAHLPGATSLAAETFLDSFEKIVAERWPAADPATIPVVFYCYGRLCVRSRYCSTHAALAGYRNLIWFRGGFPTWRQAGYPEYSSPYEELTE